jgi:hypothetical protein
LALITSGVITDSLKSSSLKNRLYSGKREGRKKGLWGDKCVQPTSYAHEDVIKIHYFFKKGRWDKRVIKEVNMIKICCIHVWRYRN